MPYQNGSQSKRVAVSAGVAGASGGTLVVVLADYIDSALPGTKGAIIYCAPTITIALSAAVSFAAKCLWHAYKSWQMKKFLGKLALKIEETRAELNSMSSDKTSSNGHRVVVKARLEKLIRIRQAIHNHEIDLMLERPDGILADLDLTSGHETTKTNSNNPLDSQQGSKSL
jgi:hypothetical protein